MKKTRFFIYITALLITLLIVVGCDVSPASVNNGLVRASINIGNNLTKDLIITNAESCRATKYRIALIPQWDKLENGSPIYGQIGSVENGKIKTGMETAIDSSSIDLGYITPGKWTVYVEALNKNDKVVMSGSCTTFFTIEEIDVFIILQPVSEGNGQLDLVVNVQKLSVNNHEINYKLYYSLEGNQTGAYTKIIDGKNVTEFEMNFDEELDSLEHLYRTYGAKVSVPQDYYIIKFILKEYNEKTKEWDVVGGITRSITVVADDTSYIFGDVMPSEFIPVEVDVAAPSIQTSLSTSFNGSKVKKDTTFSFTCKDESANTKDYNREFIWYVNGDKVLETTSETTESVFSNKSYFSEYGNYEVRCEVVYYTDNISFIGGSAVKFQIIP